MRREHGVDVLHERDVLEADWLVGQEGGGDGGQDGVLRAADPDLPLQAEVVSPGIRIFSTEEFYPKAGLELKAGSD